MAPLDYLQKHNTMKIFSEFHIERDSSYLAPPSTDILDIDNLFSTPVVDANIDMGQLIVQYLRQCPPHQSDQRIAYIVLCSDEWRQLEATGHIQLSNIDPLMQQGFSTSTSTSTSISKLQQMRSTSRSHLRYFMVHMTRLLLTSRIPTAAALPRLHLGEDRSSQMSLGHVVFYVHTAG